MVSKHETENHSELIFICFGMKYKKFWQKLLILWKFKNTLIANFLLLLLLLFTYVFPSYPWIIKNRGPCVVKGILVNIRWMVQGSLHQSLTAGTRKLQCEEPCWCQAGLGGCILPPHHPFYLKTSTVLADLHRSRFVVADLCLPPSTPVGLLFWYVWPTWKLVLRGAEARLFWKESTLDCPVSCSALVGLNELWASQLAFPQQVTWKWNTWRLAEGNAP